MGETHRHCQCDNCSGEGCGQDNPNKLKAEQEAARKEHDDGIRKEAKQEGRDEVLSKIPEIIKREQMVMLKDLQFFIDDPDSHMGCPHGTIAVAYLVRWMGARGYDCD
jgi:hypothetical protein